VEEVLLVVEGVEIIIMDLLVADLLVVLLVQMVEQVILHHPLIMAVLILVEVEEDVIMRDQLVLVEVD
tara:strand:- start:155 stop:358 length:204 start_codon:yes stop_codon:yes gene_type:complete